MKISKNCITLLILITMAPVLQAAGLEVQYRCLNIDPVTQQIQFQLNIVNNSDQPVNLQELKIHYYYTGQDPATTSLNIDYALFGSSNVLSSLQPGYLELGFTAGAGIIPAGGESGEVQLRLYNHDWSVINQADDYSFLPGATRLSAQPAITLENNTVLLWGTSPGDQPAASPQIETGAMGSTPSTDMPLAHNE